MSRWPIKQSPGTGVIVLDRSEHADNPHLDEIPALVIQLTECVDRLIRAHGVEPIVWEILDNGVVMRVVPYMPADCNPELRKALNAMVDIYQRPR